MRVLHFYKNALPETVGGVEQVIDQIARGTGPLGVENIILALSNTPSSNSFPLHGYELFTAKRNFELASNGFSWQSIGLFKQLATKADLVHYHFPWPFADLVHKLVSPKKPTVLTYHSDIVRQKMLLQLYRPLKQSFLKSVDHIVATSPNYLKTSGVLQTFTDKASVIPIGLDDQTYSKPDADLVKHFKECFGERFFFFIGAFRYYKGLNFLIKAAKVVPYPIVLAGSGPIEKELKSYVQHHQLKNVFFIGQVSEENKCALLEACYGLVLPSNLRSEAFGVTLLEGAMFGKPLISCEIGTGTSYINIGQETGLVIPPSNLKALADAMTWLWTHPEESQEMGHKARARYVALFTAKNMAQSYFELYQKLVGR
jgi:glycosyltransferase involved in cell wall biosynthesis